MVEVDEVEEVVEVVEVEEVVGLQLEVVSLASVELVTSSKDNKIVKHSLKEQPQHYQTFH